LFKIIHLYPVGVSNDGQEARFSGFRAARPYALLGEVEEAAIDCV